MKQAVKATAILLSISMLSGCSNAENQEAAFNTEKTKECITLFEGLAKDKAIPKSALVFLNNAAKSDQSLLELAQEAYEVNTILAISKGAQLNTASSIRVTTILAKIQQFCESNL